MIAPREEQAVRADRVSGMDIGRQQWIQPEVRRMDAGSAEQGGSPPNTDLGVSFS